ncbi:MAG: ATP-binding protein [Oscillospiraceae bacterium]
MHLKKQKKCPKSNLFLLGQILLGAAIIAVIIISGNLIYHGDLDSTKQIRLNTEIDNMKEIISNKIIRIGIHRDDVCNQFTRIINFFTTDAEQSRSPFAQNVKNVLTFASGEKYGDTVQAIIDDGSTIHLINRDNPNGVSISQAEKDALLEKEMICNSFEKDGQRVTFFALMSDIDDIVKEEEHELIHQQKYTDNSYIWVNEILDMNGGDNYAIRRIHPNLTSTEGEYLSTSTQDIEGNFPYKEELDGIRENGEVVHQYYFKNLSDDRIVEKVSYAALYEPYNWIVGIGTPLETIYSDIEYMAEKRFTAVMIQISAICVLVLVLMFINVRRIITNLSKATREAERANKAKSDFLFNMSHDIRTPMNAILGFTALMEKDIDDKEKLRDYLGKIKSSGDFLLSLINNVLEMAKIESGKVELDETAVDLMAANKEYMSVFDAEIKKKNLTCSYTVDIQHKCVYLDETKVREIFSNLISNAIKYTTAGGKIDISMKELTQTDESRATFKVEVADTGIGMSPDFLPHLFDSFVREHNSTESKIAGTGLGLPIVKSLVELMGGTIEVESELGKGTKFTVIISYRICDKSQTEKQQALVPAETSELKNIRILLAEDNDLNAEIATALLENMNFTVERAVDGIECVDMVEKACAGHFDVVLMDIQMPNMNGFKATELIRKLPDKAKANIPIIAMTANAFAEDKKAALDAGMNAFVAKPVNIEEILSALQSVLDDKL